MIERRIVGILIILCLCVVGLAAGQPPRNIRVIIRVDDIFMATSRITPVEIDAFLRVAEKHGAHVTLATIPNRLLQPVNRDGRMTSAILDAACRGHQIAQHGFNHQCEFTSATGREFSTSASLEGLTQDRRINRILEGRRLLEAVTGKPVTTYVGPGEDDFIVLERDLARLRSAGYTWLGDAPDRVPVIRDGKGSFPPRMEEFTWQLDDANYAASLDQAKRSFTDAVGRGDLWEILFHDHFTRAGYSDGITLRWFDELLTWIDAQPGMKPRYLTLDEYMACEPAAPIATP